MKKPSNPLLQAYHSVFKCISQIAFLLFLFNSFYDVKGQSVYSQNVKVPEIDPRQYIVIYEWKEANEDRWLKSQKQEHPIIVAEVEELKRKQNLLEPEVESLRKKYNDCADCLISQQDSNYVLKCAKKTCTELTAEEVVECLKKKVDVLNDDLKQGAYKLDVIKKNVKTLEKNTNSKKPFNFSDSIVYNNAPQIETYKDYYNHYFWRNGGTPMWEPIWWLNQYPWPSMSYRELDLQDADMEDLNYALIPFQKYSALDPTTTLRLVFDKNGLAENEDFKGQISVEAFLYDSKKNGADPREIEVNPYSVIGQERKAIGLNNQPAREVADNLLRILTVGSEILAKNSPKEAQSLYKPSYDTWGDDYGYMDSSIIQETKEFITYLESYETDLQNVVDTLCQSWWYHISIEANDNPDSTFSLCDTSSQAILQEYNSIIKAEVKKIIDDERNYLDSYLEFEKKFMRGAIEYAKGENESFEKEVLNDYELLEKLVDFFIGADPATLNAFISLMGTEEITFNHRVTSFKSNIKAVKDALQKLKSLKIPREGDREVNLPEDIIKDLSRYKRDIYQSTEKLININGSVIANFLQKELGYCPQLYKSSDGGNCGYAMRDNDPNRKLRNNPEDLSKVRSFLAQSAGKILYQDLIYATIDLDLADADAGDQLVIQMIWNKEPTAKQKVALQESGIKMEESTTKDGVVLYLAKFDLVETGWKFSALDNALLIKRPNEDLLRSDYPLNSMNFKLTGGVSVMWGYNNDFRVNRKIKTYRHTNIPKFNRKGDLKSNKFWVGMHRTVKWMEPSFGLNVSYLDYREDEPFEVGIGPSIGLWDNLIFFTGGVNLMDLREQTFYYGIGLSFLNLGSKLTD